MAGVGAAHGGWLCLLGGDVSRLSAEPCNEDVRPDECNDRSLVYLTRGTCAMPTCPANGYVPRDDVPTCYDLGNTYTTCYEYEDSFVICFTGYYCYRTTDEPPICIQLYTYQYPIHELFANPQYCP